MRKTPLHKGSVRLILCRLLSPTVFCCLIAVIWQPAATLAQTTDSLTNKIAGFPLHLLQKVRSKTADLDRRLTKQTEKYLQRIAKREERLKNRLYSIDPTSAGNLFGNPTQQYAALAQKIRADTGNSQTKGKGAYMPYLDSLRCSTAFLQKLSTRTNPEFQSTLSQLQALQAKMNDADQIRQVVRDRKEQIKAFLLQHGQIPGLPREYQGMNQDLYYFTQQVQAYKDMLNDPDKLEKKALSLLDELPAFRQFMQQNSQLAALFGMPANYGTAQSIAGLPSRDQVQQVIQSQLSGMGGAMEGGGGGEMASLQQRLESAQSQLDQYKDKLSKLGAGGPDVDMPDFKPNDQRTKSFLKRLEIGTDLQTTKNNYYFPVVTDLGISVGYKLGHSNSVGVGASYKVGWGSGINHIALSSQGIGLASYDDIRIKDGLSATGGLEYDYQTPVTTFQQIK